MFNRIYYIITLHYITLHYITLHYITLHYITLHYITLHYITLHYITLHYITLHYTPPPGHHAPGEGREMYYLRCSNVTLKYFNKFYVQEYTFTNLEGKPLKKDGNSLKANSFKLHTIQTK